MKQTSPSKNTTSLVKWLVQQMALSRRAIVQLIKEGDVKVNGETITSITKEIAITKDKILVKGQPLEYKKALLYYKFYKPTGVISTLNDPKKRKDLTYFLAKENIPDVVFPIGRLDRDTTGLLLFTNDGEFANTLLHPKFKLEKEYKVTLDKPLTKAHLKRLQEGFFLDDGPIKMDQLDIEAPNIIWVIIHEGRNRIVRRTFEALGYKVVKLKRYRMGPYELGKLKKGSFASFKPRK